MLGRWEGEGGKVDKTSSLNHYWDGPRKDMCLRLESTLIGHLGYDVVAAEFKEEGISQQNLSRVRRFQRELEAAEDRAEAAEGNLSMIRAKHRSWVTTNQIPGGGVRQVFITEETSSNY